MANYLAEVVVKFNFKTETLGLEDFWNVFESRQMFKDIFEAESDEEAKKILHEKIKQKALRYFRGYSIEQVKLIKQEVVLVEYPAEEAKRKEVEAKANLEREKRKKLYEELKAEFEQKV